jgi:vesicle-fusing ATPase
MVLDESGSTQKRNVVVHGLPGTGKTTAVINFARHHNFAYLKIISPDNLVGLTDSEKIRNISKVFEDAYRTTNACIVVDNIERIIEFCPIGRRFSNNVLQAFLLLLEKRPPKENCRLLIIATTSCYTHLKYLALTESFDVEYFCPHSASR